MKKLIGVIVICAMLASCGQPATISSSLIQSQGYYTEQSKTVYLDGYVPCNGSSFIWLDSKNILFDASVLNEVEGHTTTFYRLNIKTNECIPYEIKYKDFFSSYSVFKQNGKYSVSNSTRNVITFDNSSWQPTGEYFDDKNYAAFYDLATETTYEYDYSRGALFSEKDGVIKELMSLSIPFSRYKYVASLKLSADKTKIAFAVMQESMSTQIITLDLVTNQQHIYELSLPLPGITWLDDKLFILNYHRDLDGVYAQLFDNGEMLDEINIGKSDGSELTNYSNNIEGFGVYENSFPFINTDMSSSALSILNVKNDKLKIALIDEIPSYAHSPQISKDGKHVAYYIIDGESVLDPDEKRYFVVQKLD